MKDKIKELEPLLGMFEMLKDAKDGSIELSKRETDLLLDCITNLQEGNENRISESLSYDLLNAKVKELENRIDKAIEYIKENKIEGIDDDGYSDAWFDYVYVRDLLNILQGEDKE